ncbi:cation-translocating P-type ATPase [Desulfitobacterium sp. THU1]|uniref:heavy metal translocating P-type ATPase n=1 Tax=Desulfitobacterium sp. THU1 TaxID=3138072 RepID=UPI00311D4C5F
MTEFFTDETKRSILFISLAGISLILSFFYAGQFPLDPAWVAIILCGLPIIKEGAIGLFTRFDIKADVLVSLALIAAVTIGEIFAAGEVAFIMQIGALLETLTVAKAQAGIERLIHITPRTARRMKQDQEELIPAEEVQVGDVLRVLPGETVPADGLIIKGKTSVDQSVMTGESLPVDKQEGDEVATGTVNQFGAFDMQATVVGENSSLQRMIRLVQSADADKAKIVGIADRWATWIVVIALLSSSLTWYFTGEIIRAVTILVVFCPCALVLATPTAIMAAIGNATKYGILVREGDALERLAQVKRMTFDKTGTLTYGKPKVVAVQSYAEGLTHEQLYNYLASAELNSEHPLGKAIVSSYKATGQQLREPQSFQMIPGRGVSALIDGKEIYAGNAELLQEHGIDLSPEVQAGAKAYTKEGSTVIYIAMNNQVVGLAALSDTLRETSFTMVESLKAMGIHPVLLTGDHKEAAHHIATQVQIPAQDVHADCLPEDKLKAIEGYQEKSELVCMVGDGINDAPALKKAHVGIAMGGIGSDIAVEAADIALVGDDISQLPHLLGLSQRMMRTIKLNLAFSLILNFGAIILAANGSLGPVMGALVHNAGSVLVIINSALLLNWKTKNESTSATSTKYVPEMS